MKNKNTKTGIIFTIIFNSLMIFCLVLGFVLIICSINPKNIPEKIDEGQFVEYMEKKGCSLINAQEQQNTIGLKTYLVTDPKVCPYLVIYATFTNQNTLNAFFESAKNDVLHGNGNMTQVFSIGLTTKYQQHSTLGTQFYKTVTLNRNSVLYAAGTKEYKSDITTIFKDFNYNYAVNINWIGVILLVTAYLSLVIILVVSMWKVEKKIRNKGWVSIVPFYNVVCLSKDILGSGWYSLLLILPLVNFATILVFYYKLGKKFGKSNLYCVLLIFFPTIVWPLLAFDDSEYIKKENQAIATNNDITSYVIKDKEGEVLASDIESQTSKKIKFLLIKWPLTTIFLFLAIITIISYFEEKLVSDLLLAIMFIIYGIMICPGITEYTLKYEKYTKYKPLIAILIFIINCILLEFIP